MAIIKTIELGYATVYINDEYSSKLTQEERDANAKQFVKHLANFSLAQKIHDREIEVPEWLRTLYVKQYWRYIEKFPGEEYPTD